jgi:Peptidase A4 family
MSTTAPAAFPDDPESIIRNVPCKLVPTNMSGAYTIPAPPDGFNALTASNEELLRNGVFWPRPAADAHPSLVQAWHRLYAPKRKIEWVAPTLTHHAGKIHRMRNPATRAAAQTFTSGGWSGAILSGNGQWRSAFGMWQIPAVSIPVGQPQGTEGGWNSASWVGIDGWNDGLESSNDVLQAGVEQKVDAAGNTTYFSFFEWFTEEPPGTPNLPNYIYEVATSVAVNPGDMVFALIQYLGPFGPLGLLGMTLFFNMSTNQAFAVFLIPPPNANANGRMIEWIMEAPDGGVPNSALPQFTPVVFQNALGTNSAGATSSASQGDIANIQDALGSITTSVTTFLDFVVINFV